jgi:ferric-dicitrate binding protein FerR (iron transport regulator)
VARAPEDGPPVTERVDDVLALLDWPSGVLLFQATPLAQVAAEVGRRFDRRVEVHGERLRALRISGTFEEERFDEVILALCQTAGAECALMEDGARIGSADGP